MANESGMGGWCGALWVNPSVSHAMAACGVGVAITNGRFTREDLHVPVPNGRNLFAW